VNGDKTIPIFFRKLEISVASSSRKIWDKLTHISEENKLINTLFDNVARSVKSED
jgi:hypothetical protein